MRSFRKLPKFVRVLTWVAGIILLLSLALVIVVRLLIASNNIQFESIAYRFPSSLSLGGLSIEQTGSLELHADTISVIWSWKSLLKGRPGLHKLYLEGVDGTIQGFKSESESDFSMPRFAVDEFQGGNIAVTYISGQDTMEFRLKGLYLNDMVSEEIIRVDSLQLTGAGAQIFTHTHNNPSQDSSVFSLEAIPGFDINTLILQNSYFISETDISRQSIKDLDLGLSSWKSKDLLSLKINRLDFVYQDSLEMNVVLEDGSVNREFQTHLHDISIGLPGTKLAIDEINADFSEDLQASLNLGRSYFSLGTLREFIPAVNEFLNPELEDQEKIFLSGKIRYKRDSLTVNRINLETPGNVHASAEGYVIPGDKSTHILVDPLKLAATNEGLATLLRKQEYQEYFNWPDSLELNLKVNMPGDTLYGSGDVFTSSGDIRVAVNFLSLAESSSLFLTASSESLEINRLTDMSPVNIKSAGLDFEMSSLNGTTPSNNALSLDATLFSVYVEDTYLDSIFFGMNTREEEQKLMAEVNDDSLSLVANLHMPAEKEGWSDFELDLEKVHPSMLIRNLNPGRWQTKISGKFQSLDEVFTLNAVLSETRLRADSLTTDIGEMDLSLTQSDDHLEFSLLTSGKELAFVSTGLDFPEFQLPLTKWLDHLPEMRVRADARLNSSVLTWLTGKATRVSLESINLLKSKGKIELTGGLEDLQYGDLQGQVLKLDLKADPSALDGTVSLGIFSHPEFEIENIQAEVGITESSITNLISFNFADTLGRFGLPLQAQISEKGYLINFVPGRNLVIADKEWEISENKGILISDSLEILEGDLGIRQGKTHILAKTTGDQIRLEINSLNAAPVLSWFLETDRATASINAELSYNRSFEKLDFSAGSEKISAGDIPPVALELEGSLAEESLSARAKIFNPQLSINADILREEKDFEYQLDIRSFNLGMLSILPFWPADAVIAGSLTGSLNGVLGDRIRNQGYLLLEDGSFDIPALPSKLSIDKDSLFFQNDRLEFRNFQVLDEENHSLRINGDMVYYPRPIFSLSVESQRFRVISEQDPEMIGGDLQVNADLKINGSIDKLNITGNLETLEGGRLVYITQSGFNMVDPTQIVTFMSFDGKDSIDYGNRLKNNAIFDWDVKVILASTDLKVILDQVTQEYLQVSANGNLNLRKGINRLPVVFGTINSGSGSAFLKLPAIPDLDLIVEDAQISWNGPLEDPTIDFNGYQLVRTTPSGLAVQFNERSDVLPFKVQVELDDASLSELDVGFDLEGGDAPTRDYISSLPLDTRQTYAINLLVFGRFGAGDNPNNPMMIDRITSKLNEISRRNLKHTDLSFSAASYDNASTGTGEVKTDINYKISRDFLNSRLSFSVGGNIGAYSEQFEEPSPDQLLGNIEVRYRLSNSPPLVIKGSHEEVYEGVIDGDVRKTSLGLSFQRSWKRFSDIFKRDERRRDEN